jgi:hypothetical protein
MGKRRTRAERAIDEISERAAHAIDVLTIGIDDVTGRAGRRMRKSRKRIESARKEIEHAARRGERRLGHRWNRGRLRARQIRRKADHRIDRALKHARARRTDDL